MESLTEKVLEFQKSGAGLDALVRELAPTVYQFPSRRMGLDEDACGDFYLYFQPRLLRMLGRFQDQGRPFEAYLAAGLGWQLRSFARARRRADRTWSAALRLEQATDGAGQEGPADGCAASAPVPLPPELSRVIRTDSDRRHLLFLILKCPRLLDGDRARVLAGIAGIGQQRLQALAAVLSEKRAPREARLADLAARRNRAFCLSRLLEGELRAETDPRQRQSLEMRLAKAQRRMRQAMQRMARVGLSPTNREIAGVLGVPKGTVDSGLFLLKKKLAGVLDPDSLRTA
jgi:RNA polymerase sigma factor (sigma-70 family)